MMNKDTPLKRGSDEYKKIVEQGCGYYSYETDCGYDFNEVADFIATTINTITSKKNLRYKMEYCKENQL